MSIQPGRILIGVASPRRRNAAAPPRPLKRTSVSSNRADSKSSSTLIRFENQARKLCRAPRSSNSSAYRHYIICLTIFVPISTSLDF